MKTIAKPIEMICLAKEDGLLRPIKFKISAADGAKKVYEILQVYTTDLDKIAGLDVYRFTCEISINDLSKLCEIRYTLDTCQWILFKI